MSGEASRWRGEQGNYRLIAVAVAALAVVARLWMLHGTHSSTEDFFITLRYAENIAHGRGFVYNLDQRVLGTTTPLYTLLLALAAWLRLDPIAVGKALNIAADGATCYVLARLLAALGRPGAGWVAALLYATASAPINFSIGGMETGLVTLAGLTSIYFHVTRRALPLYVALAVLFLLRIDGLLLAAILTAAWILRDRRVPMAALAAGIIIIAPWLVFAALYFGSPLPVSMLAKVRVYGRMFPGLAPHRDAFATQFARGAPQIVLLALFLIGAWAVCRFERYRDLRPALAWLVVYYVTVLFSKVIAFGWYFVPPLPIYYAVAVIGAVAGVQAFRRFGVRSSVFGVWAEHRTPTTEHRASLVLLLLAVPLVWHLRSIRADIAKAQHTEDEVRLPIGRYLAAHYPPTDTVFLEPIGYVGYYSGLRVLDAVGLVSPEVLPYYTKSVRYPFGAIAARFRPDLMVLRPSEAADVAAFSRERGGDLLGRDYRPVSAFPGPDAPSFTLYARK